MVSPRLILVMLIVSNGFAAASDDNDDDNESERKTLGVTFTLQQIYLPLDGLSANFTSPAANSRLAAVFPNRADIRDLEVPPRQGSNKTISLDGKSQYGLLRGSFDWLYDLEKSPTGITILFYFNLTAPPKQPAYLLSAGDLSRDPLNAAGWDIWVSPVASTLEIRFGYRTYTWRCSCAGSRTEKSGSVGVWHSVHASCRNYFGLLQCNMAADGIDCSSSADGGTSDCRVTEYTPNYDASRINTLYIGTQNPASFKQKSPSKDLEALTPMMLDEIRIFNMYTEVDFSEAMKPDRDEPGDLVNCCAKKRTEATCLDKCLPKEIKTISQTNVPGTEIGDSCGDLDECAAVPCQDICINFPNGYHCSCQAAKFLADDSSSCYDFCSGVTCQLNTDCIPSATRFQCGCNAVSSGTPCQRTVDLCAPNPCQNDATCVTSRDTLSLTCICPPLYVGDRCEEEVTDCARQPCRNGGTCVLADTELGFKCTCQEDYSGIVCEKVYNPCDDTKCANDGVCLVKDEKAVCNCTGDFIGDLCDQSSQPCQPNPCQYGGTCTPDGLRPVCTCRKGLTGKRCETDVNECLAPVSPCSVNATCLNTIGSFICGCPPGYALPNCTDRIDLCSSSPCQNGATCTNGVGSYACTCAVGYLGVNCDIQGADRCTVTASEKTLQAGKFVTYIMQCASLGDTPSFYFNMGDRLYFYLLNGSTTSPVAQDPATDYILAQTNTEITLQAPTQRFVYLYQHWFAAPGEFPLTVQVYNKDYPSSKYITVVGVKPNGDHCFPAVAIVNGGFNLSSGPPFQRSYPFVIQSVVTISPDCYVYNVTYKWTLYKLTADQPTPVPGNVQALPAGINVSQTYLKIPSLLLPYGSYMNELNVTYADEWRSLVNLDRGWFNITATPLKMDIQGGGKRSVGNAVDLILNGSLSFDPDQPSTSQAISYYWFGYQDHQAPHTFPVDLTAVISSPCTTFPSCSGYIGPPQGQTAVSILTLPGSSLSAGTYVFLLIGEVSRADRYCPPAAVGACLPKLHRSNATQKVTVMQGTYPDLVISCTKTNCGKRIDAGERFSLEAKCSTCPTGSAFLWTVHSTANDTINAGIWAQGMEFNSTQKLLAVRPEVLPTNPEVFYTFKMTVTPPTGDPVTAEFTVQVNRPPIAGTCEVDPIEGYGLETFFTVQCRDFSDEDLPLTYRFHYKNGDEVIAADSDEHGQEGTLLYYNVDPYMPPMMLPHGLPKNNYTGKLFVIAHDAFEAITQVTYNVTVRPRVKTAEELNVQFKALMSPSGVFQRKIDAGDQQGIAQTAVVISTELNHMAEHGSKQQPLATAVKTGFRDQMIGALDDLPVHSLSALQQVAASLSQVAAVPEEISPQSQAKAADLLTSLGQSLTDEIGNGTGPFELHETAAYIVSAVTNVLGAVDVRTAALNPHRDPVASLSIRGTERFVRSVPRRRRQAVLTPELSEAKDASNRLVGVLKTVLNTYGTTKLVGEDPTEFTSPELRVGVSELYPDDVAAKLSQSSVKDYFVLPELNLGAEPVQVQTLFSENSLYSWDPSGAGINTPNVELAFKNPESGEAIDVTDLEKPIHVVLPIKNGSFSNGFAVEHKQWTMAMPAEFYSSMNLTVEKVTMPLEKTIIVRISTSVLVQPLSVLISEGVQPSLENHTNDNLLGTIAPFDSNITVERYFQFAASQRTAGESVYYVSVAAGDITAYRDSTIKKSVDDPPDGSLVNVTYRISTFSAACLYWSETDETWKSDGCQVSNLTTQTTLHCDCNHLTTFAAGLFVPPNHIDPIKDFHLILTFFDNPVVGCIIIAIWVIYFSLLVYARRLDIIEEAKRGVHVLTDNDATHQYYYVITVCTGLRFDATTSAKVGMVLKGTTDQSDPHILNEVPDMEFFEMGGEDSFLMAVPDSLGDLMALSIWQNGEGIHPSWYVDEVLVRDIQTNQLYFFLPNRWLAAHKADHQLSVEVPVADAEKLTSFWHRFTSFTSRGLRDSHLWFSVLYRPSRSKFTRAQRLTCILSLLLTTMLASFMFYKPVVDESDQRSSHGFTFNFRQIMVGIQSGLIALPVNVLVIQCFIKAAPKKGGKKVEEKDVPKGHGPPGQLSKTFLDPAVVKLLSSDIRDHVFLEPPDRNRVEDSAYITHANRPFPYWTAYIAWATAITTSLVASFFVFFYGLRYGRTVSIEWTVSFFSAVFQDVLITQPAKVLATSCLIALLLKRPLEKDPEGDVVEYPDLNAGVLDVGQRARYKPPTPEWVAAVRKIALLTKRMNQWLVDIGWFVVFMVSIFVFTYGNTPLGGYGITQTLNRSFKMRQNDGGFMNIRDVNSIWKYLETTFVEGMYPVDVPRRGLAPKAGHYTADMVNIVLGPVRLRQVRIRPENCLHDDRVVQLNVSCIPAYSLSLHETRTFKPGWVFPHLTGNSSRGALPVVEDDPLADNSEVDYLTEEALNDREVVTNSPWVYRTAAENGMGSYGGELSQYPGGGYISLLPHTAEKATAVMKDLEVAGWVDNHTRAIFVQFNTYNPNANLFTISIMLFEFHGSGLIVPSYSMDTIRLFIADKKWNHLTMGFGVFASFLLVIFTINMARFIVSKKLKYFRDAWNWLDMVIVVMGWTTFALYFIARRTKLAAVNLVTKADPERFVGFYFAMLTEVSFINMSSCCFFACTIKLLKILRITRQINRLLYVLAEVTVPLAGFLFSFLVSVLPFIMAGYVIFGRSLKRNSSFSSSFITIMRIMVVDAYDLYKEYSGVEAILGPLYFAGVVISVLYIYTNMLLALIMVIYSRTIVEHREKIERDAELSDFLLQKVQGFLGLHVENPVVDLSKFPAAAELRDLSDVYRRFERKPDSVDANDWGNFLNMTEIRKLTSLVVGDIRTVQRDTEWPTGFRTDFASNTEDWYYVETVPTAAVEGASTNPVNKLHSAKAVMEGTDDVDQYESIRQLDGYITNNINVYREMLVSAKLSGILISLPPSKKKKTRRVHSRKKRKQFPKK